MRLYLLRHGHAAGGTHNPGLSEKGAETIRRMAGHLVNAAKPTEIRHSVKRRARETAEILAGSFAIPTREVRGLAPNDPVEPVAEELAFAPDDVMIVSHMPFIDRLLNALVFTNGGGDRFMMMPGSAVALERSDVRPGKSLWWIRWFVSPEVMP